MENSSVRNFKLKDLNRKCLLNEYPLKQLNRTVQFVVADKEDTDLIRQYLNEEFVGREPMNASIDLTCDEFSGFIEPTLKESMSQNVSVLAVDDGYLCGLFLNNVLKVKHTGNWKEPQMKDDYGPEFDSNETVSKNFKKIAVMLGEMESYVAQNLPSDAKEYVLLDILSVHRDYVRNGLAKKLTIESCKWALQSGYKFAQITGSSVATNHIARGMGFTEIFTLDLKKFKNHGIRVFPDEFPGLHSKLPNHKNSDLQNIRSQNLRSQNFRFTKLPIHKTSESQNLRSQK